MVKLFECTSLTPTVIPSSGPENKQYEFILYIAYNVVIMVKLFTSLTPTVIPSYGPENKQYEFILYIAYNVVIMVKLFECPICK